MQAACRRSLAGGGAREWRRREWRRRRSCPALAQLPHRRCTMAARTHSLSNTLGAVLKGRRRLAPGRRRPAPCRSSCCMGLAAGAGQRLLVARARRAGRLRALGSGGPLSVGWGLDGCRLNSAVIVRQQIAQRRCDARGPRAPVAPSPCQQGPAASSWPEGSRLGSSGACGAIQQLTALDRVPWRACQPKAHSPLASRPQVCAPLVIRGAMPCRHPAGRRGAPMAR